MIFNRQYNRKVRKDTRTNKFHPKKSHAHKDYSQESQPNEHHKLRFAQSPRLNLGKPRRNLSLHKRRAVCRTEPRYFLRDNTAFTGLTQEIM